MENERIIQGRQIQALVMLVVSFLAFLCVPLAEAHAATLSTSGPTMTGIGARARTRLYMHGPSGNTTSRIQLSRHNGQHVGARTFQARSAHLRDCTGVRTAFSNWVSNSAALTDSWVFISQQTRTSNPVGSRWRSVGEVSRSTFTWAPTRTGAMTIPRR